MTVEKFIKALELLGITELDIDVEDISCAMTMRQNTDLYNSTKINKDWVNRAVLEDKFIRSLCGVRIIIDNRLPKNPNVSTDRMCPFWAKSRMHFGSAIPYVGEMDRVPTRQNQLLIQGRAWYAATRSEDEGVVCVYCRES